MQQKHTVSYFGGVVDKGWQVPEWNKGKEVKAEVGRLEWKEGGEHRGE